MVHFILVTMVAFSINSCGDAPWFAESVYSITVQNNSTDTIQFYASYSYPDTTITNEKPRLKMAYPSKYSYWDSKEKWEDVLPSDTISMYILSKDTVDRYSWDKIRSDYNILKRYDLSLDDLKKQRWIIEYP